MTFTRKIEVGSPITANQKVLFPIEKTSIFYDADESGCWCNIAKQVIALVAQPACGVPSRENKPGAMTVHELTRIVPELEAYLERSQTSDSDSELSAEVPLLVPEQSIDVRE